jgi:hypothetical protein
MEWVFIIIVLYALTTYEYSSSLRDKFIVHNR